ncbi:class D sortase [Aeribacillus composti]|uniref:Class D sortase n=1 Tax=Aeribacillus composti TaxID=1868734 RepID=A0ABY9WBQ8_9BACI|nr:class D sortase [Aeribacillus composti]WNF33579.1 class D sortase [Aeribacillus composti]
MLETTKRSSRNKRLFLLFFASMIILAGLWFSAANSYKLFKGMLLPMTHSETKQKAEAAQPAPEKNMKAEKVLYPTRPKIGEQIGELFIPKLNAVLPIYHGTNEEELEKGVGHFAGSVLPGEADNSVLSGHRDTVFRRLGEVGKGDELIVTTSAGEFTYKIYKVRIVDKDDRTVIVPKPRPTLTVSTCYPFHFIGSAPERYVLVAYLVSEKLKK